MKIDRSAQESVMRAQKMCPELPWNCWDVDKLGPTTMKYMEDQEPFFSRWAEIWYQNMQFVYGNQSLRWSRRYGYATDSDFLRREPVMNQRAQTNLMRTIAESLSAMIYSNLPTWEVDAARETSLKSKRFQKIIQNMLDAYMERLSMDREFATAAMSYVVFGQMAAFIDWDQRAGKILTIPQWEKKQTPIYTDYMAPNPVTQGLLEIPTPSLDSMGQPRFENRWEPVLDASGRQVHDTVLTGDVKVDMLTPFEYRREIGSQGPHKSKYWQRIRLIDYDEFLDEYGSLPGRTAKWNGVRPVYTNPAIYRIAMRHFMRMQMTTPPALGEVYQRPQSMYRSSIFKSKVLLVDHYDAPHALKWKNGRRVIIVNGDAVVVGEPQYHTIKDWHPFVEAQWFNIAPSSMASGPITDSIQKNRELNVADSLQATALRRNMGSQLLIKTGAGFDPQRMTGEPGMMHVVNDPYAFRWLHDDMPIPPAVPQMRQQIKDDVYETSAAGDAIRGQRTVGADSGYAQRQQDEREVRRISPARKIFGYFVKGIGEKMWTCLKANVTHLDENVMGYLQRCAAGEYTPADVVALLSSEVDFGVEINVKADSMAAKSKATDQATLLELLKGPAAARANNPKVLDEIFKFFDVEHLRDESSAHRDRAVRENEIFTDMMRLGLDTEGVTRPIVVFEDDDDIHIGEHTDFMVSNTDEILKNPEFYREFLIHIESHRLQKQEKEGQLMPGTAQQTPQMMNAVAPNAPPSPPAIAQDTIVRKAQQQQQQRNGPTQPGSPQAPKQPTAPGQPKQTDPTAPSKTTSQGAAA